MFKKLSALTLSFLFCSQTFAATCVDITGQYSAPANSQDLKITHTISQSGCESVMVMSMVMNGGVTTTQANFSLDGTPARNCLMDVFNNCGSLKLTAVGIEKHDPQNNAVVDPTHGFCQYEVSVLSKDARGNLVESFDNAECEDGYKGKIAARIFPKK